MNGSQEGSPAVRPIRPQYHYFYGSTAPAGDDRSVDLRSSVHTELESLVGEFLVSTDNEEEPSTSGYDHKHIFMSNGRNGGMRHIVGGGLFNGGSNETIHEYGETDPWEGAKSFGLTLLKYPGSHPMAYIIALVGCMTICLVVFAVTVFPSDSPQLVNVISSSNPLLVKRFFQSFLTVDRSRSNDPAHLFLKADLFHPDLHYQGRDPARIFNFAFPTGAFWTNLVLPPTADRGFSYPIVVYPYAYKWSGTELTVSYPYRHRKEEEKAIHDYFQPDLTFGVMEDVQQRYITNFDPLSVTLQYTSLKGSWKTYLVQGSPYVTIEYNNATPKVRALSTFKNVVCPGEEGMENGNNEDGFFDDSFSDDDEQHEDGKRRRLNRKLLGVCGVSTDSDGNAVLRGVQFVLQSQEGANWIVFASEPISLVFDPRIRTEVAVSKAFTGTIRLAIIPPSSKLNPNSSGMVQIYSSTGLRRLVYHASVYPVGAKVDYDFIDPVAKPTTASVATTVINDLTGVMGGSGRRLLAAPVTKPAPSGSGGRVALVNFRFETKGTNSNVNSAAEASGKSTGLLMLSLPHQAVAFTNNHLLDENHFDLVYHCVKGQMTPVVGSIWTYEERLLALGFESAANGKTTPAEKGLPTTETVLADQRIRKLLAENLETDLNIASPSKTENIYGFGKQIARLAQLAHIADRLVGSSSPGAKASNVSSDSGHRRLTTNTGESRLRQSRQKAADDLYNFLDMILTNDIKDSLLFDASLGGLISSDGLADVNADFGNGRYNDHHFHYGYLLYACAVMGKLNATFVETHGNKVDSIMHDVAYNANMNDGSFFPLARHMSWFDGHSYASGLFPFANGKSQESSSEAVNCYYGAYLWSLVRSGSQDDPSKDTSAATDFARLLLAMEVRGAKTYWHMLPPESSTASNSTTTATQVRSVYSPTFAANYMVGNVGMLDVICSTWFGTENLYVHMINFLPVTSITRELFNKEYVTEEYAHVISQYPEAEMAWRGYVVSDHALVDPTLAWKEALTLQSALLDSGFSKTQALYFILTSPSGFDLSQIMSDADDSGAVSGSSGDAACVNYDACLEAGLQGLCCPTPEGTNLGCCGSSQSKASGGLSSGDSDGSSCSSHAACSGLVGQCCPTLQGVFLGCCDQPTR